MSGNKERLLRVSEKRSPAIASFVVVEKEADSGEVFVSPDDLEGVKTLRVSRRRLLVYSDGSGKYLLSQKWREEGITIRGYRTGGASRRAYIFYEVEESNGETYPLADLDRVLASPTLTEQRSRADRSRDCPESKTVNFLPYHCDTSQLDKHPIG